jgi:hypothetical protein
MLIYAGLSWAYSGVLTRDVPFDARELVQAATLVIKNPFSAQTRHSLTIYSCPPYGLSCLLQPSAGFRVLWPDGCWRGAPQWEFWICFSTRHPYRTPYGQASRPADPASTLLCISGIRPGSQLVFLSARQSSDPPLQALWVSKRVVRNRYLISTSVIGTIWLGQPATASCSRSRLMRSRMLPSSALSPETKHLKTLRITLKCLYTPKNAA